MNLIEKLKTEKEAPKDTSLDDGPMPVEIE